MSVSRARLVSGSERTRSVWKKWALTIIVIGLIGLMWCGYVWLKIRDTTSTSMNTVSDVGIVLGASMWGDSPSPGLKERLDHGLKLYKEGKFHTFIVSGGLDQPSYKYTEAEGMRNYLLQHGVPDANIVLENKARDTYQNLLYSQRIMEQRDWRTAIIITHTYHGMRSLEIATFLKYNHPTLGVTDSTVLPMSKHQTREVLAYTKWKLNEILLWLG
ncbi:YdcF family protein [Paenibacillus pini]|uniref:Membrane associated protein n=1 Tax=Paenibacillus pini JCM 16418 TaxID=1236976 RepID=W7YTW2_9BACL|nr:YdcF family protein [Paenibacillus pini]GAF10618.1 membrane associated protein [Paenibacillus pini JCM 16418]